MSGLESYGSGQKTTWRGWQWNRIVERLPEFASRSGFNVKRMNNQDRSVCREKTVLYLCGPDDVDYSHAERLGFSRHNMIAVDIEKDNIAKARKGGAIGVAERFESVIYHWPADWHIDVIVADLCGGITRSSMSVVQSAISCQASSECTVVSFNLMRGRDPECNTLREKIPEEKHRGRLLCIKMMTLLFRDQQPSEGVASFMTSCHEWMQPAFCSYKGSRNVMDSMVCRLPLYACSTFKEKYSTLYRVWREDAMRHRGINENEQNVKNKLKALRAVRTMAIHKKYGSV